MKRKFILIRHPNFEGKCLSECLVSQQEYFIGGVKFSWSCFFSEGYDFSSLTHQEMIELMEKVSEGQEPGLYTYEFKEVFQKTK